MLDARRLTGMKLVEPVCVALAAAPGGRATARQICDAIGHPSAITVARALVTLAQKGWASSETHNKHSPTVYIITDDGRTMARKYAGEEEAQTPSDRVADLNEALRSLGFHKTDRMTLVNISTGPFVSLPLGVMDRLVVLALKGNAR